MVYEILPHTADARLCVRAPDLNALFAEAALGFFSLIVSNLQGVLPRTEIAFNIEGSDLAYLLADWLNELLYTFESKRLLLSRFATEVTSNGLTATAQGEEVDASRHVLDHEVKAVTYHGLRVERSADGWIAEVVLDI